LAGWGSTGGQTGATILQKAILSTITIPECRQAINDLGLNGDLVDYTNLCTGPLTGGLSACSGDSG
jgi:acetyl-CoA carboxylase beta subunit